MSRRHKSTEQNLRLDRSESYDAMAPQNHVVFPKTLCWAAVPVWESLKVTLKLLKFGQVALDYCLGA
jgi:hypothetical protein